MNKADAFKMMLEGAMARGAKLGYTGSSVACQNCIINTGSGCAAIILNESISTECFRTIGSRIIIMDDDKPTGSEKAIREWIVSDLAPMISVHS